MKGVVSTVIPKVLKDLPVEKRGAPISPGLCKELPCFQWFGAYDAPQIHHSKELGRRVTEIRDQRSEIREQRAEIREQRSVIRRLTPAEKNANAAGMSRRAGSG